MFRKFDGRASAYSRYRPGYPNGTISILVGEAGFSTKTVVADIGSGTGILSELFLSHGNTVYCVEPNKGMRAIAERNLAKYAGLFKSVDGTAEATRLEDNSVDMVAVGQALHWFNVGETRKEFRRILKRRHRVCIIYNDRRKRGKFESAYTRLVETYSKDREKITDVDDDYVSEFLGNREFKKSVLSNSQVLDYRGLLGRLASASYMPRPRDAEWAEMTEDARMLIMNNGDDGRVVLHYDTRIYIGSIL